MARTLESNNFSLSGFEGKLLKPWIVNNAVAFTENDLVRGRPIFGVELCFKPKVFLLKYFFGVFEKCLDI